MLQDIPEPAVAEFASLAADVGGRSQSAGSAAGVPALPRATTGPGRALCAVTNAAGFQLCA